MMQRLGIPVHGFGYRRQRFARQFCEQTQMQLDKMLVAAHIGKQVFIQAAIVIDKGHGWGRLSCERHLLTPPCYRLLFSSFLVVYPILTEEGYTLYLNI